MSEAYRPIPVRRGGRRARDVQALPGTPAHGRELRAQGRKTMGRLLDAGLRVFADRGFQAARVDDIVRAARTSHGTFYLYFSGKDDLLRALAVECARELDALAAGLGPVDPGPDGRGELRRFLEAFLATYSHYGPVIRAWMEGHAEEKEASRLGVQAFTEIASALGGRLRDAGAASDAATVAAVMALLERTAYYVVSRRLDLDRERLLDTLTLTMHRGFFGAAVSPSRG